MLVLSRKIGERIVIGDNITLVVQKIGGNRVAIGVEAPADVSIVRAELKGQAERRPGGEKSLAPVPAPTSTWSVVGCLESA